MEPLAEGLQDWLSRWLRPSCALPRGGCQAEKPRPGKVALSFFLMAPICKRACMGANKKTIVTVVTTVSRLGGEDKILRQDFVV